MQGVFSAFSFWQVPKGPVLGLEAGESFRMSVKAQEAAAGQPCRKRFKTPRGAPGVQTRQRTQELARAAPSQNLRSRARKAPAPTTPNGRSSGRPSGGTARRSRAAQRSAQAPQEGGVRPKKPAGAGAVGLRVRLGGPQPVEFGVVEAFHAGSGCHCVRADDGTALVSRNLLCFAKCASLHTELARHFAAVQLQFVAC